MVFLCADPPLSGIMQLTHIHSMLEAGSLCVHNPIFLFANIADWRLANVIVLADFPVLLGHQVQALIESLRCAFRVYVDRVAPDGDLKIEPSHEVAWERVQRPQ